MTRQFVRLPSAVTVKPGSAVLASEAGNCYQYDGFTALLMRNGNSLFCRLSRRNGEEAKKLVRIFKGSISLSLEQPRISVSAGQVWSASSKRQSEGSPNPAVQTA